MIWPNAEAMYMKILVTGASGYLGAVIAPSLQAKGQTVIGLDAGFFENNLPTPYTFDFPVHKLDIRNLDPEFLQGYDIIVHLAALSTNPLSDLNHQLTEDINYLATKELAKKAKKSGVKQFIFASTCCVYGTETDDIFNEESPTHPSTVYASTKLKAEESLHQLADNTFKVDILRNATVFGISPSFRSDIVVNSFLLSALLTGKISVFNNGMQWRPLVDIEDVTEVVSRLVQRPSTLSDFEIFNVGFNENNFMVKDIVEPLLSVMPEIEVEYHAGAVKDKYSYRSDFSKLLTVFPDLKQKNGLRRSMIKLKKALEEMLNHHTTAKTVVSTSMFHRHEQIKKLIDSGELTSQMQWV